MVTGKSQIKSNLPLAYVRGKIKSKMILVKVLIDSGNLCADLISEKLAKDLKLKIDTSVQRNIGTGLLAPYPTLSHEKALK